MEGWKGEDEGKGEEGRDLTLSRAPCVIKPALKSTFIILKKNKPIKGIRVARKIYGAENSLKTAVCTLYKAGSLAFHLQAG